MRRSVRRLRPTAGTQSAGEERNNVCHPGPGCYKYNGCPDSNGCDEYSRGYYASGISVKNATAIFQPGIYYLVGRDAVAVQMETFEPVPQPETAREASSFTSQAPPP